MRVARLLAILSFPFLFASAAEAATPRQAAAIIKPKVEQRLQREGKLKPGVNLKERLGGEPGQNTRPFTVTQLTKRKVGSGWITEGTITTGKIDLRRERVTIRSVGNAKSK